MDELKWSEIFKTFVQQLQACDYIIASLFVLIAF